MAQHYSVHELADLSGVSVRTLHHYDKIGLLVPGRAKNGYRLYGPKEVARLQLILLYRACGIELSRIGQLLDGSAGNEQAVLEEQLVLLTERRRQLDQTIANVRRTLDHVQKEQTMDDRERFEGLKRETINHNEQTFGKEARQRHGEAAVDAANEALLAMDEQTWNDMNALEGRILELLRAAQTTGDVTGEAARALVSAHARWLQMHWGAGAYNAEAHRGLADGYLHDDRFVAYYDNACGAGATQFLRDAIHAQVR